MKSLYCIAGSLPAQFRSSSVDCGIGWKEHAKQEPKKADQEGQDRTAVGIESLIDLSEVKIGDKIRLVRGATFKFFASKYLTIGKIYEVCDVDLEDNNGLNIKITDDINIPTWVFTKDVRKVEDKKQGCISLEFNTTPHTINYHSLSGVNFSTVKAGDKVVLVDGKTLHGRWGKDFTENKVYEVDFVYVGKKNTDLHLRLINNAGDKRWVYDEDVREVPEFLLQPC